MVFCDSSQNGLRHYPSCSLQTGSTFSWMSYRHLKIPTCPKIIHYSHLFLLHYSSPSNLAGQAKILGIIFNSHFCTKPSPRDSTSYLSNLLAPLFSIPVLIQIFIISCLDSCNNRPFPYKNLFSKPAPLSKIQMGHIISLKNS